MTQINPKTILTPQEKTFTTFIIEGAFVDSDVNRRMQLVKAYMEKVFFTVEPTFESNITELTNQYTLENTDLEFIHNFEMVHRPLFEKETFYEVLEGVRNEITSYPRLLLHIPCQLDTENRARVGKWARDNIDPTVILSLRIKPNLIIGCGIMWNMNSIEHSFDSYFQKVRPEVYSLINTYDRA